MKHRERSLASQCVLLACSIVVILSTGAGAALPDGRGYEIVSPPEKNNGVIQTGAISAAGDRLEFSILAGPGDGSAPLFLAKRTPSGWSTASMMPPSDQLLFNGEYSPIAWTPTLSGFVVYARQGLLGSTAGALLRLNDSGSQTVLAEFAHGSGIPSSGGLMSDDGSHAYSNPSVALDPGHVPGTLNVYDFASIPPVLVDRLPDESVPACGDQGVGGSPGFSDPSLSSTVRQHWISVDGSRVFFLTPGNVCDGSVPPELYVRDRNTDSTTLISGPALSGSDQPATFLQASANGSQVVYATSASLVSEDTNGHPDVYRYTAGVGNECLTCLVSDANVVVAQQIGFGVAVSEDLSHVYFTSRNQLVPGKGTDGVKNLYVWKKDPTTGLDTIDWVAPGRTTNVINNPTVGGANSSVTPDGNVLVFTSSSPDIDAVTPGHTNGGFLELYRYDDREPALATKVTCISCPPDAAPTLNVSTPLINTGGQIMSDDGNTIFFRTREALVPHDMNASNDIYEWHSGQIGLISDGMTPHTQFDSDQLFGTSPTGADVFFSSYSHLTPDVIDNSNQLYDARVGAPEQAAVVSTACGGEQCQGSPSVPPALADPITSLFTGVGNATSGGPAAQARFAVRKITTAQRLAFGRTGRLTLPVTVTLPGTVSAVASGRFALHVHTVATASHTARGAGTVKLVLRLSGAVRRQLAASHSLRITITIRYSRTRTAQHLTLMLKAATRGSSR